MSVITCFECKPKWQRLVDAVFVRNMDPNAPQKLVNYCIHKTDKLHRIVELLHQYLHRYLKRKKEKQVYRVMNVMDRLMVNCHQQLNHFVIPFLSMVHQLLEEEDSTFQLLGTAAFVEFCKVEEEIPNYHREYDNLLEHFTRMCIQRNNYKIRDAGIGGIEGIITKTSNDLLQVNLYQSTSMDKIIPSLLFNITITSQAPENEENEVSYKAVEVFQHIVRWATTHDMKPIVSAVLRYLEENRRWESEDAFAKFIFQQISEASQASQSGHRVVKMLIEHLSDLKNTAPCSERVKVVEVISHIIAGLAKNAVGPDLFHIFKMLLEILRSSIEKTTHEDDANSSMHQVEAIVKQQIRAGSSLLSCDEGSTCSSLSNVQLQGEREFQEAVIAAIGEFAKNLPDEQKLVILKFILNFDAVIHIQGDAPRRCATLIKRLLETMYLISAQYHPNSSIVSSLTSDFLPALLASGEDPDLEIRLLVQSILHSFLDRHGNLQKLRKITLYQDISEFSSLCLEEPQREDVWFLKRDGQQLLDHLFKQMVNPINSKRHCLRYLSCTLNLLIVEMGADSSGEAAMEIMKLLLLLQSRAMASSEEEISPKWGPSGDQLSPSSMSDLELISVNFESPMKEEIVELSVLHRCRILSLTACHMLLLSRTMSHPSATLLTQYILEVVKERGILSPYLLPHFSFNKKLPSYSFPANLEVTKNELFQEDILIQHFENMGCNTYRMRVALKEVHRRQSLFDFMDTHIVKQVSQKIKEEEDLEEYSDDERLEDSLEPSPESTPFVLRRSSCLEEYSFNEMKRVINLSNEVFLKRQVKEQERLLQYFRQASFKDIWENQQKKLQKTRNTFYRIVDLPMSGAGAEPKAKISFPNLQRKDRRGSLGSGADSVSAQSNTPPYGAQFSQAAPTLWEISYPSMLEL